MFVRLLLRLPASPLQPTVAARFWPIGLGFAACRSLLAAGLRLPGLTGPTFDWLALSSNFRAFPRSPPGWFRLGPRALDSLLVTRCSFLTSPFAALDSNLECLSFGLSLGIALLFLSDSAQLPPGNFNVNVHFCILAADSCASWSRAFIPLLISRRVFPARVSLTIVIFLPLASCLLLLFFASFSLPLFFPLALDLSLSLRSLRPCGPCGLAAASAFFSLGCCFFTCFLRLVRPLFVLHLFFSALRPPPLRLCVFSFFSGLHFFSTVTCFTCSPFHLFPPLRPLRTFFHICPLGLLVVAWAACMFHLLSSCLLLLLFSHCVFSLGPGLLFSFVSLAFSPLCLCFPCTFFCFSRGLGLGLTCFLTLLLCFP